MLEPAQTTPHAPQFAGSLCVSTQLFAHDVKPDGHALERPQVAD